ncbi:N5-carboxyaminoimidazole ribonucleotide synthase [Vibrio aerogenes CECT 7868]|uniref:N5-carboxyaminoimidazole ribonucleotide synthase n=1 Tax=Vibrio aerogenes CECT 7868 TaxID=1216006 RepID=A0A1M6ER92_9VIBR|nr:5-(carboxyamino)imidazole ribonucleotide synthase [Vibrio aerogenes]SHI88014.1 N5-carboxyaminoimidazole ribonucleotide synthase [Vibrio aerogenes CECT 7868]
MHHVLVLGAGQLAQMMSLAGAPLNIKISAFDVVTNQIVHPLTQEILGTGLDTAIAQADVITAEFEHIPHDILYHCEKSGKLRPGAQAIKTGGDRRLEKKILDESGVESAKYYVIETKDDFEKAIQHVGIPMVLKTALGGYDGKGQWRLHTKADADAIWQEIQTSLESTQNQAVVAEAFIPFDREVSLVGARDQSGKTAIYSLSENIHTNGVLSLSTSLHDPELQNQAHTMFKAVADALNYTGVLALEFFDVSGNLLVNEIAPRVHNSGHWTQEGAETCQFENHLRAVCGLPLGCTKLLRPTSMINILGENTLPEAILDTDGCHVHWYGKEKRPGRKMGHINVCAENDEKRLKTLCSLAQILDKKSFPALHKLIEI